MIHQHLTEAEVQAVATGEPGPGQDSSWEQCPECREQVEAYRSVFQMVAAAELPDLGMDLAAAVMARLPQPAKQHSLREKDRSAIWSFVIPAICLIPAYFLSWAKLRVLFNSISLSAMSLVVVTVSCIAAWMIYDLKHDYDRRLRSLFSK
jgi:hypothetical protein